MTRLFRYFVFSLCLLSCGCFLKASVAQGDNNSLDDAVSNAMEAARKKWMRELSVYCTFKYTEGCADTIEKGWSGDYDTSRTRKLVASGTLVKTEKAVRLKLNSEVPAAYFPDTQTAGWCSFDTACANDMCTFLLPKQRGHLSEKHMLGGTVAFGDHSDRVEGDFFDNITDNVYQPLLFCGGNGEPHFEWLNRDWEWDLKVKSKDKHVILMFSRRYPSGSRFAEEKTYKFWVEPATPVLTEFEHSCYVDEKLDRHWRNFASDFVKCGDGILFPQTMKAASGLRSKNRMIYRTSSWLSENAGTRLPEKEDFEFVLPDGMKHVSAGPELKRLRKFNVLDLKLSDRIQAGDQSFNLAPPEAGETTENRLFQFSVGSILVGILLVFRHAVVFG